MTDASRARAGTYKSEITVSEGRRAIPHEDETNTVELKKAALDQYSVVRNEVRNNSLEVAARACAGMDRGTL